jgi:hypothetical protein
MRATPGTLHLTLLAALALTFLPSAAAQTSGSASINFQSPGEVLLVLDGKISGEDASQLRQSMDQPSQFTSGNGDGTVQQSEVDAIEAFFRGLFDEIDEGDVGPTGSITVDGKGPQGFALVDVDIRDATGPVTSESPITIHIEFKSTFNVTAADRHTVRLEGNDDGEEGDSGEFGDIGTVTLKAPKGYVIESAQGLPAGAKVSSDKKSINYDGVPTSNPEDTVIVFARSGGSAAGYGFLFGVGVLIAVVALRRP